MRRLLAIILAVLGLSSGQAPAAVLDIGDSHSWLSGINQTYPSWTVDAQPGRASTESLEILRAKIRPRYNEVIFDLATNDHRNPDLLGANLRKVWRVIRRTDRSRDLTLVTSWVPANSPASTDPVNVQIERFAALHPRHVDVAQWGDLASQHPEWDSGDHIHFSPPGYEARKRLVRNTMRRGST